MDFRLTVPLVIPFQEDLATHSSSGGAAATTHGAPSHACDFVLELDLRDVPCSSATVGGSPHSDLIKYVNKALHHVVVSVSKQNRLQPTDGAQRQLRDAVLAAVHTHALETLASVGKTVMPIPGMPASPFPPASASSLSAHAATLSQTRALPPSSPPPKKRGRPSLASLAAAAAAAQRQTFFDGPIAPVAKAAPSSSAAAASSSAAAATPAAADDSGSEADLDIEDDGNMDYCSVCGTGGSLVCCDVCPASSHATCAGLTPDELPDGVWLCADCTRTFGKKRQWVGRDDGPMVTVPLYKGPFLGPKAKHVIHTHTHAHGQAGGAATSERGQPIVTPAYLKAELRDILLALHRHAFARAFLKPVPRAMRDYYAAVTRPMDLGTVVNKLNRGLYDAAEDGVDAPRMITDMRLVVHNCRWFNTPMSTVWRMADVLGRELETALRDRVRLDDATAAQLAALTEEEIAPLVVEAPYPFEPPPAAASASSTTKSQTKKAPAKKDKSTTGTPSRAPPPSAGKRARPDVDVDG